MVLILFITALGLRPRRMVNMPKINLDGTITIPSETVKNMDGNPNDEIVFEEWLDPEDLQSTIEVSVMLRSKWDREMLLGTFY